MERCRPSVGPGEAEAMGFDYLLGRLMSTWTQISRRHVHSTLLYYLRFPGQVKLKLKNGHTEHASCRAVHISWAGDR